MEIFREILLALETEERVMLATIISTTGSTPASALSKMLIKHDGIVSLGTVGGGCMEGDVLLHARRLHELNRAEILTFHLNEDDIEHGLMCGGSLDVLIEPLTGEMVPLFKELTSRRSEGEDSILATLLNTNGQVRGKFLVRSPDKKESGSDAAFIIDIQGLQSLASHPTPDVLDALQKVYHRHETQRVKIARGELLLEPISGSPGLIIFGGGHVSKFVSRAAALAGFQVSIVDDREKYANPQRFPEAVQTLAVDFTDAFGILDIKQSTYIVIVTRGHKYDEEILEYALKTPARYIGMIGSKRKILTTYKHLAERGVSPNALLRVHAPMGIEIGAVTPEEIGISIVAQLIRVRRGERMPLRNKSDVMSDLIADLHVETLHS